MKSKFPYILSGLTCCGKCEDRLIGKSAHGNGGKVGYYEHGWRSRKQSCLNKKIFDCKPHRVPAKKLEPLVWEKVVEILKDKSQSESIIKQAHKIHSEQAYIKEIERIKNKIHGIGDQLDALAEHLTKIPKSVSPVPIYKQMEKLEELRVKMNDELRQIENKNVSLDIPASLKDYKSFLKGIQSFVSMNEETTEIKRKIIPKLIHKIEVFEEKVKIHYLVGFQDIKKGEGSTPSPVLALNAVSSEKLFFSNSGSRNLTNGAGKGARTLDLDLGKVAL